MELPKNINKQNINIDSKDNIISDSQIQIETEKQNDNKTSNPISEINDDTKTNNINTVDTSPASILPTIFHLVPNNYSKSIKSIEAKDYYQNGKYIINKPDLCLISDKTVGYSINSWKIQFFDVSWGNFTCCAFGLISIDDPNSQCRIYESQGKYPLVCLCCNGQFLGYPVETVNPYNAMKYYLGNEDKTFKFEYNKNDSKFNIYLPNGNLFGYYDMNKYEYAENMVFLVTTSGEAKVDFSFSLKL